MTRLFGDKNKFAIQTDLEYETDSGTAVGPICLWIGGDQIGDYEGSIEVLGFCQAGLHNLTVALGTRIDSLVNGKSKETIYEFLTDAVLGDLREFSEGTEVFENRFHDFLLCPELGEAFEDEVVVTVDVQSYCRFIWRSKEDHQINEIAVSHSEIRIVSNAFSEWLDAIQASSGAGKTQK